MPPPHVYSHTTAFSHYSPLHTPAIPRSLATRALHLKGRCCSLATRALHLKGRCYAAAVSLCSPARGACGSCAVNLTRLPARSHAAALAATRACRLQLASPRSTVAVCAGRLAALAVYLSRGALFVPARLHAAALAATLSAARACRRLGQHASLCAALSGLYSSLRHCARFIS
eukprot:2946515-Pleurochrysis_carterae.AAC.1